MRSLDLKRCNKRLGDLDLVGLGRAFTVRVLSLDGCENITDAMLIEVGVLLGVCMRVCIVGWGMGWRGFLECVSCVWVSHSAGVQGVAWGH